MKNPNALTLNLDNYTEIEFALNYQPSLADDIERWIKSFNTPVIINCQKTKVIFAIYFNSLLYDLIQRLGISQVKSMVAFENLNELNERTYASSKLHVERWCTDPDYRECIDILTKRMVDDE